jgi:hypothetical protein
MTTLPNILNAQAQAAKNAADVAEAKRRAVMHALTLTPAERAKGRALVAHVDTLLARTLVAAGTKPGRMTAITLPTGCFDPTCDCRL